jgi:hypothetical protein
MQNAGTRFDNDSTHKKKATFNVQPAYAESFGVARAHLSRRREAKEERPTLNEDSELNVES